MLSQEPERLWKYMDKDTRTPPAGSNVAKFALCLEIERVCQQLKKSKYDLSKIMIIQK